MNLTIESNGRVTVHYMVGIHFIEDRVYTIGGGHETSIVKEDREFTVRDDCYLSPVTERERKTPHSY